MENYLLVGDAVARHHIEDLVAAADDARRTKLARSARTGRSARKFGRVRHA